MRNGYGFFAKDACPALLALLAAVVMLLLSNAISQEAPAVATTAEQTGLAVTASPIIPQASDSKFDFAVLVGDQSAGN